MSCGLHDVTAFEALGRPAVLIASDVFAATAATQAAALGMDGARRVFVPHPVQDRTDAEIQAMAEEVVDEVVAALTR